MTRQEAEIELKSLFGFSHFHDLQWEVIDKVLNGQRVLFIEKTGFGKSLCYQFPATQMDGLTIVFSPLIALMRDQVKGLLKNNIRAASINSNQEYDENIDIIEKAKENMLDILFIAPERLENVEWITAARQMKISMIVVDEAHCISMWGHTFRPNYRRIVNLVKILPGNFPVLATTATATKRVEEDIIGQIGSGLKSVRGELLRSNISLHLVRVNSEDEKFFWMAQYLQKLPKPGIIYTGTRSNTHIYSNWLEFLGLKSAYYSGRLDPALRNRVEEDFMGNKLDCVVSTNALGMGIDKPDIRFIVHTQITQSPIHYYQEIGRAGRDGNPAHAILLYNEEKDDDLPLNFIESSKPSMDKYNDVIEATKKTMMGLFQIIKEVNLKQTEVRVILSDLVEQRILNEVQHTGKKYFYNPEAPEFDSSKIKELKNSQMKEFEQMKRYTQMDSCRMIYLCDYLGDQKAKDCGICDNETGEMFSEFKSDDWRGKMKDFRETFFPVLEVESNRTNLINGIAGSYYGVSNVGSALHHSKYQNGGDFPDWLLGITLKAYRKQFGNASFDLVLYVPPTESGDLVQKFSGKIASLLKIPLSHELGKISESEPQKGFNSNISKRENVKGIFNYKNMDEVVGKRILLIDDIFDSGHTIKEIGSYLTELGAQQIAPLVIAKTVSGDTL